MSERTILQIAVANPLRQHFDYLAPKELAVLPKGVRVRIPYRNKETVGYLIGTSDKSAVDPKKLKSALAAIDVEPILPANIMRLCHWASDYYHYSIGEVISAALPKLLRDGQAAKFKEQKHWRLLPEKVQIVPSQLARAKKQKQLLDLFKQHPDGVTECQIKSEKLQTAVVALKKKGWLEESLAEISPENQTRTLSTPPILNPEQQHAVDVITKQRDQFNAFLLDGITGSGKTEVYLRVIQEVINDDKTCLILVPEIGLTPQTVERFRSRFNVPVAVMHSGLNDRERLDAWLSAKQGIAKIVIGTRSAIFIPLQNLGLIIIDEEHDASFKQQDSFRYSARDLSIVRGHMAKAPVILGSATPSMESLQNVKQERYQLLKLTQRAGNASLPTFRLIDLRNQKLNEGLSEPLIKLMQQHISQSNQVLLFINRRGFAPVLMCHRCGWIANCRRCDAHLTLHLSPRYLQCHHCMATRSVDKSCPQCSAERLMPLGLGTERLEQALQKHFPDNTILRIDRDTTRRKGSMENYLQQIHSGEAQILLGTQMLAKGHHFPNVTLVGILDADSGLFSSDFRASERLGQLIMQVAGRAGRAEKTGEVVIQTHNPDHVLLNQLIHEGYENFSASILQERQAALLPPFSHLAIFRTEAFQADVAVAFLQSVKLSAEKQLGRRGEACLAPTIYLLGPIPSPMEKRAGKFRHQLLIQSQSRPKLHELISQLLPIIEADPQNRKLKWTLDIDPIDIF